MYIVWVYGCSMPLGSIWSSGTNRIDGVLVMGRRILPLSWVLFWFFTQNMCGLGSTLQLSYVSSFRNVLRTRDISKIVTRLQMVCSLIVHLSNTGHHAWIIPVEARVEGFLSSVQKVNTSHSSLYNVSFKGFYTIFRAQVFRVLSSLLVVLTVKI